MLEGGNDDNKIVAEEPGNVRPYAENFSSYSAKEQQNVGASNSASASPLSTSPISTNHDYMNKESSGGIVVARGTGDGLILRLDGRVERHILLSTLLDYVESRKSFFSGQEVTLEWIEARPEEGVVSELSDALAARFQLLVKASRMFERSTKAASTKKPNQPEIGARINESGIEPIPAPVGKMRPIPVAPMVPERTKTPANAIFMSSTPSGSSLFDGVTALAGTSNAFPSPQQDRRTLSSEALLWDEPDTRIIRETLRGGQKIESEHSVVIVGDVNSGAEIVAGGDIFVLGRLRGVAHAGAYDESGGGRKIFSLQMQPTQLRIGSIISQGSDEGGRMPEIAKIEGNMIVVEPYGAGSQVKRLR